MRRYSPICWPGSTGIGGRNEMESPAGIKWNGWPESNGITDRDHLEYSLNYLGVLPRLNILAQDVNNRQ